MPCAAVMSAKRKPEHAAVMSKATALWQPHCWATLGASPAWRKHVLLGLRRLGAAAAATRSPPAAAAAPRSVSPAATSPRPVLRQQPRGGSAEHVLGRRRRHDHEPDVLGAAARPPERDFPRRRRMIRERLFGLEQAPRADPRARRDPLVGRVDDRADLLVRQPRRRPRRAAAGDDAVERRVARREARAVRVRRPQRVRLQQEGKLK